MNRIPIREQILEEVDKLNPQQQEQLLRVARQLQQSTPPGTPGEVLLALAGRFRFAPDALDEMVSIIEEEREKIDWEGWQ